MSTTTLSGAAHRRPVPTFLRHLGEMTLAMFAGMFAFGLSLGPFPCWACWPATGPVQSPPIPSVRSPAC